MFFCCPNILKILDYTYNENPQDCFAIRISPPRERSLHKQSSAIRVTRGQTFVNSSLLNTCTDSRRDFRSPISSSGRMRIILSFLAGVATASVAAPLDSLKWIE